MFSGIVADLCEVKAVHHHDFGCQLVVDLKLLAKGLAIGHSVAVNGVCLTVIATDSSKISFDVIHATLKLTNLKGLSSGTWVNVERALTLGSEIGGHILSGHVASTAVVEHVVKTDQEHWIKFSIPPSWRKYFHTKGFIALDGVSLTLHSFDHQSGCGLVHLIPETLKRTTLGHVRSGTLLNFEVDTTSLAIVDTVERYLAVNQERAVVQNDET